MKNSLRTGTMIAFAAAGLFATACKKSEESKPAPTTESAAKQPAPDEKTAKIQCEGVNACKGQGGCKSAANACAGQNGCKGKGHVTVASEEDCKTQGGTVMAGM